MYAVVESGGGSFGGAATSLMQDTFAVVGAVDEALVGEGSGGGFWKVGYYVGTAGAVSEEVVERYIEGTEHAPE
jgi:REP element-mobilizing transposase RayT